VSDIREAKAIIGEKVAELEGEITVRNLSKNDIEFIGNHMQEFTLIQEWKAAKGRLAGINFSLGADNSIARAVQKKKASKRYPSPHP
jgi:hypothetical protein